MKLLVGALRVLVGAGAAVAGALSVLAFFGSVVPQLDLINHLQLILFFATLLGVLLTVLVFPAGPRRGFLLSLTLLGFLASAIIFVPEWTAALAPRAPLPGDGRPTLKLMTHNVFGLNYDMERVNQVIIDENPDIIALQEYFGEQAVNLHPLLKERYPYFVRCKGGKRANLGLYSKIPFDKAMGESDCPDNAYGGQRTAHILARFTLANGASFSVLTSHMDWPFPIERQRAELADLARVADEVGGPLIIVGDFNSTPWSYALRAFGDRAGLTRHTHNLVTYPLLFTLGQLVHTWPFLPLDHVFTKGDIAVHELHAGAQTGSDHLPVFFTFSVGPSR